ncbi:hypothetical protein T03_5523 [Trichinella britovi]|uniref:Uncharacterized protein n=1 Tax=Trichinella britovi TaxID=45882 RepID=A0A0V1AHL3_TRIBR|nr:hypothetical protein T03_5523 [Trichinella britovi]
MTLTFTIQSKCKLSGRKRHNKTLTYATAVNNFKVKACLAAEKMICNRR